LLIAGTAATFAGLYRAAHAIALQTKRRAGFDFQTAFVHNCGLQSPGLSLSRRIAMSLLPEETLTTEEEELERKKARLAELEGRLADRELELASFRAELVYFEKSYLQTVGRRYAILDELKAKIAEARAKKEPRSDDASGKAREARQKAQESARAAGEVNAEGQLPDDADSPVKPKRSESLDKLYRRAAKLLHPDLTLDAEERKKRHRVMAELNSAYARGDEEQIRAILREWESSPENVQGDGPGAELIRVIRKIAQVEKRLNVIAADIDEHRQAELFNLKLQVEDAFAHGRDLLKELADDVDEQIAAVRKELKRAVGSATP
jgi:hypothetical protein